MLNILRGKYQSMNRSELHNVAITPRGNRSERWLGLQHGEFIERIIELLDVEFGIVPFNEKYAISPNEAVLIGGFELGRPTGNNQVNPLTAPDAPNQLTYAFGCRHSNDSRYAISAVSGGSVMICENGIVSGEDRWNHKHTIGFQLKDFIMKGLKRFFEKFSFINTSCRLFNEVSISQDIFDQLLLILGRSKILPWKLLEEVDSNWLNPQTNHQEFCHENLWCWYNTVNETIKKLPPMDQYTALGKTFNLATSLFSSSQKKELEASNQLLLA